MVKNGNFVLGATVIAALMISTPAQAGCWSSATISAAKVRDMETMLMVAALRCRNSGYDFLSRYNNFVRKGRGALTQANDQLRAHFSADVGAARGLNEYDRYVTSIANRYGAGAEGLSCRDMASITEAAAAEGDSFTALEKLAERADVQPIIRGNRCAVTVALKR
jgi:hypothetical protein